MPDLTDGVHQRSPPPGDTGLIACQIRAKRAGDRGHSRGLAVNQPALICTPVIPAQPSMISSWFPG